MSKPIKEILIGTMVNGPQVMNELAMAKISGQDIETRRNQVQRKLREYHPSQLTLRVLEKEPLDPLATRIRLTPTDGPFPVFEAGQYINVFAEIQGVRTSRPYSIATPSHQRAYADIIVARKKGGFVSDYLIDELKVGDMLTSTSPLGVFRYQPLHHKHHQVMLAGGSGITPMQSMILTALESGMEREMTLFYGARKKELLTNHALFMRLAEQHPNFHYIPVLSEEEIEGIEQGFITHSLITKYVSQPDQATFFLCGPEVMNTFCTQELEELNVRRAMIRRELFQSRSDIENEPGWPENISPQDFFTITCADRRFQAKAGETLLASLEREGIKVPVGCRSGECSYCRMKLVSGTVFTAKGSLLRLADEVFGYIHTCKAYPVSDVEVAL